MAAINSYAALKLAIIDHAWRVDDTAFDTAVPGFIAGAESMMVDGFGIPGEPSAIPALRTWEMETLTTLTVTAGEATLPLDFAEARKVVVNQRPLEQISPMRAAEYYSTGGSATPINYTLVNGKIMTYPAGSGSMSLLYYARLPALSDAAPTNWLLAKNPLAYLYGALMLAEPYMRDDTRIPVWNQLFRGIITGLNRSSNIAKYSNIRVRTKGFTP
jgi:hypothetical protein